MIGWVRRRRTWFHVIHELVTLLTRLRWLGAMLNSFAFLMKVFFLEIGNIYRYIFAWLQFQFITKVRNISQMTFEQVAIWSHQLWTWVNPLLFAHLPFLSVCFNAPLPSSFHFKMNGWHEPYPPNPSPTGH